MSKSNKFVLFIFLFILFSFVQPQGVYAHAILVKATPGPQSHLESSPPEIVLSFNERLEKELYSIKVLNNKGETISKSETKMSEDQRELHLNLPTLTNGIYTITYSIISADGHPVRGAYPISVGETSDKMAPTIPQNDLHEDHGLANPVSTYILRALYYLTLLLVTGWLAWGIINSTDSEILQGSYRQWSFYLQQAFLILNFGIGLLQFVEMMNGWDSRELFSLLTGTMAGVSWVISMALSIGGFFFLNRNHWLDGFWVILLLASRAVNGHAVAYDPPIRTVLLDIIHLLAAAFWTGGLFYIIVFWKRHRDHMTYFLPKFSKVALLSILSLIVTGTLSTFIFLPKIHYLLYTAWGIFLISKIVLVLLVVVVAGILRWKMKYNPQETLFGLVKLDFFLMIFIVIIVGIFTQLSPVPQNKPLSWHENAKNVEFIMSISPNSQGDNDFMLEASSHQAGLEIKRIELYLKYKDNPDVGPIQIPFEASKPAVNVHDKAEGPFLPFTGNWTAEVRVLDSEDNETIYSKDFIVF